VVDPGRDLPSTAVRLHEALGRDLVYRFRLRPEPAFEYVSRSCVDMTGYTPEEHYADPELGLKLVHPEDLGILKAIIAGTAGRGPYVLRWVRRDGSVLWTEHHAVVVVDEAGRPAALEGIARDVTDIVLANESTRATQLGTRSFLEASSGLAVIVDPVGRIVFANDAFLTLAGYASEDVIGRSWAQLFRGDSSPGPDTPTTPDRAGAPAGRREAESVIVLRDGSRHRVRWTSMAILDARGRLTGTASMGEDLTLAAERDARFAQLSVAVEHATDSVVIADHDGRIVYVNRAFERATGYSAAEVLGQNPRILQSGHQGPSFYRVMWWLLGRGKTWRGEFVNRRKDGSLLIEEAIITPVRSSLGAPASFVAVKRDVTRLRQLRASLDDAHHQRELLAGALARLAPRETADETCEDITAVLGELQGVVAAGVALFDHAGRATLRALRSPVDLGGLDHIALPDAVARLTLDSFAQGPWVESIHVRDGHPLWDGLEEAGVAALLLIPVRLEDAALGVIMLGGADEDGSDLSAQLPAVSEVVSVARTLLAPHVMRAAAFARDQERIRSVIATGAFRPLFQPIVDLHSGRVIGFEALTRFESGVPPTEMFQDAFACGLGTELELITAGTSLEVARDLPAGVFVTLNVSPGLVLQPDHLRDLLTLADRPVVVEITEHNVIEDYGAVRLAIERLGPLARVAIDDAGAGVANFRHLVELRPDFVKLDIGLVRDIDADLTRQALIVGLKEFARVSGRELIAEGIETELERTTLGELGVRFGQGYLLGVPAGVASWRDVVVDPSVGNRLALPR
jgi:PAS domain S-box-containing protein